MARNRKRKLVTPKEEQKMYNMYIELGTYAAVAKKCHRSATCVAYHVSQYQAYFSGKGKRPQ